MLPRVGREPPADVVRDLKTILPTVELLNYIDDRWLLLNHAPSRARWERGQRVKRDEYARLRKGLSVNTAVLLMGDLMIQGYELWGMYRWTGAAPREQLMADLHQKLQVTERQMDAAFEAALEAQDAGPRKAAVVQDFLHSEGKQIVRNAIRGRLITSG